MLTLAAGQVDANARGSAPAPTAKPAARPCRSRDRARGRRSAARRRRTADPGCSLQYGPMKSIPAWAIRDQSRRSISRGTARRPRARRGGRRPFAVGVAQVQQAQHVLVVADAERAASCRLAERLGRSPVGGDAALVRRPASPRTRRTRPRRCPRRPAARRRSGAPSRRPGSGRDRAWPRRPGRPASAAPATAGPSTRNRHGLVRWWLGAQRASSSSSSSVSRGTGSRR